MAKWISANMSGFLPDGTEELFDAIDVLVDTVAIPLDAVSDALDATKTFLIGLDPFDYLGLLAALLEDFKNSFLASGIFVLQMWDYPARQLKGEVGSATRDFGPDITLSAINLEGNIFEESFLRDLDQSFSDSRDPNVPDFRSEVSMLVLMKAATNIDDLLVSTEEESAVDVFKGIAEIIGGAAKQIREIRFKSMLENLKKTAQAQDTSKVSVRVDRIERAIHLTGQLDDQQIDAIEFPEGTTGAFFEGRDFEQLDWLSEVVPILQSIENQFTGSRYPDWNKISLADIHPDITEIINSIFDPIIDLLQTGSNVLDSTIAMIDAIAAKVTSLQEILERISDFEEEIDRLLNVTGYHALYVSSTIGMTDLRSKLLNATDVPFSGNNFYAGMVLLAGSDARTAFDALFEPVGSEP